ncbi:MAG: cell division protein SepF [Firmicutes bacterium]|nr:cell division protein SepF [Bacillota bacterium]
MGFTDSLKKVIGIEEIDPDEVVTESEIQREKEKLSRERDDKRVRDRARDEQPYVSPVMLQDTPAPERRQVPAYSRPMDSKRPSAVNTGSLKLILIEPKGFEECPKLVDSLKAHKPVIINLEKLETESARKIFDFLSGATYALNGNVQKIANNIFIFTPENIAVAASQQNRPNTAAEAPASQAEERSPWR